MRTTATAFAILALAAAVAMPVAAATDDPGDARSSDALWLPWIGCWEGEGGSGEYEEEDVLVCFHPQDEAGSVEILTYAGGELLAREYVRTDRTPVPVEEGGCVGERTAAGSEDHRRVFLHSTMHCGEGVTRTTRGLMAILPDARRWIEIHAVAADGAGDPILGVRTFVPASAAGLARQGLEDPGQGRELAVSTARTRAAHSLSPDDVAEIVEEASPVVAKALMVERQEGFALDARTLKALSRRGVPGNVVDIMVALTYPDRFEIAGEDRALRAEARVADRTTQQRRAAAPWPPTRHPPLRGYSPWGLRFHDPFWSSYRFYGSRGFGGLGGFGVPFYGLPPVVLVQQPTVRDRFTVVDRNRGFLTGTSGSDARQAGPRARPASNDSPRPATNRIPRTSRPSPPSASSGGGSRVTPQGHRPSSSSGGERRARPPEGEGGGGGA